MTFFDKLPELDMYLFFSYGSAAFFIQAICSIAIFFFNEQNIFTFISIWLGVLFNFLLSYLFFTMARQQPRVSAQKSALKDDEIESFLEGLKNGKTN